MTDPTLLSISDGLASVPALATGQITLPSVAIGDFVAVIVGRTGYSQISGVTLGSQALASVGVVSGGGYSFGLWYGKSTAAASPATITASFADAQGSLVMGALRYSGVEASVLGGVCNSTYCTSESGPDTIRKTELSFDINKRALLLAIGCSASIRQPYIGLNGYVRRYDNVTPVDNGTWLFALDKVGPPGSYGGPEHIAQVATTDRYILALVAFEATDQVGSAPLLLVGQTDVDEMFVGANPVAEMFRGSIKVWPAVTGLRSAATSQPFQLPGQQP